MTESTRTPNIWIVVPAYNEGQRIGRTLDRLCALQPNVVVVDDGSSDDTLRAAARCPVWTVRHPFNCGQGAALQTGIDFALERGADVVVTFDSDGQHQPEEIDRLVAPLLAGEADIALGSRFLGRTIGMPWTRRVLLLAAVLFTRCVSRIRVTDTHNGFRALTAEAARRLRITQNRMSHASEILDEIGRLDIRYCEVPVTIHYDADVVAKGQSSWNAIRVSSEFLMGRLVK